MRRVFYFPLLNNICERSQKAELIWKPHMVDRLLYLLQGFMQNLLGHGSLLSVSPKVPFSEGRALKAYLSANTEQPPDGTKHAVVARVLSSDNSRAEDEY